MAISISGLHSRLSELLTDEDFDFWDMGFHLNSLNEAATAINRLLVGSTSIGSGEREELTLVDGSLQTLPDYVYRLVDVVANKDGCPIIKSDKESLIALDPCWTAAEQRMGIRHYVYDPDVKDEFWVYPKAEAGGKVLVTYASKVKTIPYSLEEGAKQGLPDDAGTLIDVVSNVDGRAINEGTLTGLSTIDPCWQQADQIMGIEQYAYNEAASSEFWVYPMAKEGDEVYLTYAPKSDTFEMELEEGALQNLPEDAERLIRVVSNVDGCAITPQSFESLEAINHCWQDAEQHMGIYAYVYDPLVANEFWVYPMAKEGDVVTITYIPKVEAVDASSTELNVDEDYLNDVINFCLYRAYQREGTQTHKEAFYRNAFYEGLGLKMNIDEKVLKQEQQYGM